LGALLFTKLAAPKVRRTEQKCAERSLDQDREEEDSRKEVIYANVNSSLTFHLKPGWPLAMSQVVFLQSLLTGPSKTAKIMAKSSTTLAQDPYLLWLTP
jgi:hypothetical protein